MEYLALVGVMYPDIQNKIIENVMQSFIERQDIVQEIDKLDDNYSIVSTDIKSTRSEYAS